MIRIELPGLPPTLNHAYIKTRGGARALSEEGRAYKRETTVHFARAHQAEMRALRPNVPYLVYLRLYFEKLENDGWAKGKTSRYKRLDASNRIKILEDCLMEAGGFDDSQNMIFIVQKRQKLEAELERTIIWLWDLSCESTPFDGGLSLV